MVQPLSHRPRRNSTTLSGPVYATFENGWEFRAVFTNGLGSATTNPGILTVTPPSAPDDHHPAEQSDRQSWPECQLHGGG